VPLIFVHGVAVREGATDSEKAEFRKSIEARDQLFRTIGMAGLASDPAELHIENPYWGGHAAKFEYDLASVPTSEVETFGSGDDVLSQVLMETIPPDIAAAIQERESGEETLLLTLARTYTVSHAIDSVVAAAAVRITDEDDDASGLAEFAAEATAYARSDPDTGWLTAVNPVTGELRLQSDNDFIEALSTHVREWNGNVVATETFGGGVVNRLKRAAKGLANAASKTLRVIVRTAGGAVVGAAAGAVVGGAPHVAVRAIRPVATLRAGVFLGDVFSYLADPQPIIREVITALQAAAAKRTPADDKLIVVAHSMGGNIIYDVLTTYERDFSVDLLVTVGSQVGLFKELRLFREDRESGPPRTSPGRVRRPKAVKAWLNIFDPLDVLGFAAEGVFEGVRDFAFSNQAGPLDAHSLYFFRPIFHERLRARMAEFGFGAPA
jgi:hypothetical protein